MKCVGKITAENFTVIRDVGADVWISESSGERERERALPLMTIPIYWAWFILSVYLKC